MVPLFDEVADFLADSSTVFALRKDGSLWAWGDDAFSVLGNGRESPDSGWLDVYREEPVWVMDKVTKMALGNIHALAVREDRRALYHRYCLALPGKLTAGECAVMAESILTTILHYIAQFQEDALALAGGMTLEELASAGS